eukprot:3936674-Rhodomonas_salina.3
MLVSVLVSVSGTRVPGYQGVRYPEYRGTLFFVPGYGGIPWPPRSTGTTTTTSTSGRSTGVVRARADW